MNSTHKRKFDLIVIGTGSAASSAAHKCRSAGWKVAVIDSRPFGGTCALRGCDPKKILVGAAEVIDWSRRMADKGIDSGDIRINWSELMSFKRTFIQSVPKDVEEYFTKAGITTFNGRARFTSPNTVQVGEEVLEGKYVLIAAGARPMDLEIAGEEHLITSDEFLELDELPKRIIFVGGGYISFEFAHIASRAGVQVTILHRDDQPLRVFDKDIVAKLMEATRDAGIDLQLSTTVEGIERVANEFVVQVTAGDKKQSFKGDLVMHGAGRVPDIDDLNLGVAGVEHERGGVKVNEYLQSVSNPTVYAAGDVAISGPPLTPVAGYEGGIVATNLLEGNRDKPNYDGIPSVVFTIPPLASVGLREDEAREKGLKFKVNHLDTSAWYASKRTGEKHTGFKVLIEEETDKVLGAHVLGAHAEEIINLFALAIRKNLPAQDLRNMLYAYPTNASNIPYML